MGLLEIVRDWTPAGISYDLLSGDRQRRMTKEEEEKQAAYGRAYGGEDPSYTYDSPLTKDDQGNAMLSGGYESKTQVMPGYEAQYNSQPLEALNQRAMTPGLSSWAQMQLENQKREQMGQASALNQQAAGAAAQARSALASRGGLSSGSAERLAAEAMKNKMYGAQGIAGAGSKARLGIGAADEMQRMDLMKALPGMNLAKANSWAQIAQGDRANEQFNISNRLAEQKNKAAIDFQKYQEQMKQRAADKLAYDTQYNS